MAFFRCFIQLPQLALPASWRATAIYLLTCSLIAGCGGGGGASSVTGNPDTAPTPGVTNLNIKSGVYVANDSKDQKGNATELTLIVNSDSPTSTNGRFYGLQFYASSPDSTPVIFAGPLSGIGTGNASVDTNTMTGFAIFSNLPPEQGSVSITSSTQGELKIKALLAGTELKWGTPKADSNINFDSQPSSSALHGAWTGTLYFPGGSNSDFSINFSQDLTLTAPAFYYCQFVSERASASPSGKNLFNISFAVTNANCSFRNQTFSGIAYITTTVDGKKRLQWVATSSDGKGLSFKSDLKNQ